jgi:hypothetical protein
MIERNDLISSIYLLRDPEQDHADHDQDTNQGVDTGSALDFHVSSRYVDGVVDGVVVS